MNKTCVLVVVLSDLTVLVCVFDLSMFQHASCPVSTTACLMDVFFFVYDLRNDLFELLIDSRLMLSAELLLFSDRCPIFGLWVCMRCFQNIDACRASSLVAAVNNHTSMTYVQYIRL